MPAFSTLTAALLYLAPVGLYAAMRWRRDRPLWAVALDVPVALALDLVLLLAFTRFMRLELATFAARAVWLAGGAAAVVWRRRRLRLPRALGLRELVVAIAVVVLAVALSRTMSSDCHFADRAWHIPLVSSLRGQKLPFISVYQPNTRLEYHFAGNVVAAAVQSLSFGRMHASLALSVAHMVFFGLSALTTALFLRAFGLRSLVLTLIGALAPLFSGPLTFPFLGGRSDFRGYNFVSFLHVSFRPHFPLAALFIVSFAGAALVALREREKPTGWRTGGALVALTAALTMTDEASTGLLGLALGAAWLVAPRVVHPRRMHGVLVFAALLAAVIVPHFLFGGTLGPGSLPQYPVWVPLRAPGYYTPSIPLSKLAGLWALACDFLPLSLLALAAIVTLIGARRREEFAAVAQFVALFALTLVIVCAIEIRADAPSDGGFAGQNHRFVTAVLIAAPLFVGATLLRRSPRKLRSWVAGPALVLALASLGLSGASTIGWLNTGGKRSCFKSTRYGATDDLFAVDCRRDAGTLVGGADTQPTYGAASILYVDAGCNPSYLPCVAEPNSYRMTIGMASAGTEALREINRYVASKQPLRAVCPASASYQSDPVCTYAERNGRCSPLGAKLHLCWLSPDNRATLLGGSARAKEPAADVVKER